MLKKEELLERIKRAVKEAGYSQAEFGQKFGIGKTLIAQWSMGNRNPSLRSIKIIAKGTGKPLAYFLDDSNGAVNYNGQISTDEIDDLLREWNGGIYRGVQKKLSALLGIGISTMSKILTGQTPLPRKHVKTLADAFGKTEDEIIRIFGDIRTFNSSGETIGSIFGNNNHGTQTTNKDNSQDYNTLKNDCLSLKNEIEKINLKLQHLETKFDLKLELLLEKIKKEV
jgi:transcriptional regulator with XRE-family HTH domain